MWGDYHKCQSIFSEHGGKTSIPVLICGLKRHITALVVRSIDHLGLGRICGGPVHTPLMGIPESNQEGHHPVIVRSPTCTGSGTQEIVMLAVHHLLDQMGT